VKKPWLAPTEFVHLFCERILSENLLDAAVSPTGEILGIQKSEPTAPTRSSEKGRPSLYAPRTVLNLTGGNKGINFSPRFVIREIRTEEAACRE
jgi:hypothetical protein